MTQTDGHLKTPVPSGCPVAHWFDPAETGKHPDPFPWYAQARAVGPILFSPAQDLFVATRYEEVIAVLKDNVNFSCRNGLGPEPGGPDLPLPPEIAAEVEPGWTFGRGKTLTVNDPPRHTRLRKLIAPSFTPRRLQAFEPAIREVADLRIDEFHAAGEADLAKQFAYRIPNMIIARIMGMPDGVAEDFLEWTEATMSLFTAEGDEALAAWRALVKQKRFSQEFVEKRRAEPSDDLTSDMIHAKSDDGDAVLTDEEILANTLGFVVAGSETAATMICNTVYLLLSHPAQWRAVKEDPALVPKALEESLRLRGPARGLTRTVLEEVEIGGVTLPAGSRIYLNIASASQDETVFERPAEFDVRRLDLNKHLAFGKWAHFCIGAPLARLEGRIALERLIGRLPDLRLAPEQGELDYDESLIIPGVKSLRVEW